MSTAPLWCRQGFWCYRTGAIISPLAPLGCRQMNVAKFSDQNRLPLRLAGPEWAFWAPWLVLAWPAKFRNVLWKVHQCTHCWSRIKRVESTCSCTSSLSILCSCIFYLLLPLKQPFAIPGQHGLQPLGYQPLAGERKDTLKLWYFTDNNNLYGGM